MPIRKASSTPAESERNETKTPRRLYPSFRAQLCPSAATAFVCVIVRERERESERETRDICPCLRPPVSEKLNLSKTPKTTAPAKLERRDVARPGANKSISNRHCANLTPPPGPSVTLFASIASTRPRPRAAFQRRPPPTPRPDATSSSSSSKRTQVVRASECQLSQSNERAL